jgi:hypothetical protein
MLMEPILKNLIVHPCSFLVVIMDRNAVCYGTVEHNGLLASHYNEFQSVISSCISTACDWKTFCRQFMPGSTLLSFKYKSSCWYAFPAPSTFYITSVHHHDHSNKPRPSPDTHCKHRKKYCSTISYVDLLKPTPQPQPFRFLSMTWKDVESLAHMSLSLCTEK